MHVLSYLVGVSQDILRACVHLKVPLHDNTPRKDQTPFPVQQGIKVNCDFLAEADIILKAFWKGNLKILRVFYMPNHNVFLPGIPDVSKFSWTFKKAIGSCLVRAKAKPFSSAEKMATSAKVSFMLTTVA